MNIFTTDLDNTLIYSYRHDIGSEKRCVELYEGREVSFMTHHSLALLQQLRKALLVVPVTTRTRAQYERIDLETGQFPYALVCNGGILLENGTVSKAWYEESLRLADFGREAMQTGVQLLTQDVRRCFEVRDIEGIFIFTKCNEPEAVTADLCRKLDMTSVDVFNNGTKVYIVPKQLNKGQAVSRLKEYLKAEHVTAAGDSAFDVPMLRQADLAIAPSILENEKRAEDHWRIIENREGHAFSDTMLQIVLDSCR